MYISLKYVIFYTCVGGVAGFIGEGDKRVAGVGVILAAMMGYSFGIDYAILSAIEFSVGFALGSILKKKNGTK